MYRQIRGAFIGSPLSPAWCIMVVMFAEHQWLQSLSDARLLRGSLWMATRYVDNRLRIKVSAPNGALANVL